MSLHQNKNSSHIPFMRNITPKMESTFQKTVCLYGGTFWISPNAMHKIFCCLCVPAHSWLLLNTLKTCLSNLIFMIWGSILKLRLAIHRARAFRGLLFSVSFIKLHAAVITDNCLPVLPTPRLFVQHESLTASCSSEQDVFILQ